jgi:hypothetical protein
MKSHQSEKFARSVFICTIILSFVLISGISFTASAAQIHVATTGNDATNNGSSSSPYLTIGKAASLAQAGDEILVHAGTYREWVKPPRGGTSETQRITYRAAPGEQVFIKGSNRVTTWVNQSGTVWMAELDNTYFGSYNPYTLSVKPASHPWEPTAYMTYGEWHHRGDVYCNGEAYFERQTLAEVQTGLKSWFTEQANGKTRIYANFAGTDPNTALAEINVRQSVFFPDVSGLQYITVDGFNIMQSAEEWAPVTGGALTQWGAIGPRWGYAWIIENCHISNARCSGICLGSVQGATRGSNITWGHHIIRNNHIFKCGQTGMVGDGGNCASLIDGNLVEDINLRNEFGGWECAGMKFHWAVDLVISNNCIRRVKGTDANYGIWIDWAASNVRISGNLIYSNLGSPLYIECIHGPMTIDNNILIGSTLTLWGTEAAVIANNLLYNCDMNWADVTGRSSPWFTPHTLSEAGSANPDLRDNKLYNNLFIIKGHIGIPSGANTVIDYNAYLQGSQKSTFDAHSVVNTQVTGFALQADTNQVTISFTAGTAPSTVKGPQVNAAMIGRIGRMSAFIESHAAQQISINTDYYNKPIPATGVMPGPFQELSSTAKSYLVWPKNGSTDIQASPKNEIHVDDKMKIYRTGKSLTIGMPDGMQKNGTIILADASGRIIRSIKSTNSDNHSFSIDGLAKGVYFITEKQGDRLASRTLLIGNY